MAETETRNRITDREYETYVLPTATENYQDYLDPSRTDQRVSDQRFTDAECTEIEQWAATLRRSYETGEFTPDWRD